MKRISLALLATAAVLPVTAPAAAQAAATTSQRVGNVLIHPAKDPINDKDQTTVTVLADRPPYMPVTLTWGCRDAETYDLWIRGIPYTQERMVQVTWRFDQNPPQTGQWELTQPNFLVLDEPNDFTDAAEQARTVVIRISAGGEQQTSTFQLNGLADAFKRVSCLAPPADDKPAGTSH